MASISKLSICVYASSSRKSGENFLRVSKRLGQLLAEKQHLCINGGGKFGCMGALNDGVASVRGGRVLIVIHEMWCQGTAHSELHDGVSSEGLETEIVVVGGRDLTERKQKLKDRADAFIALPGGVGTWDELWEVVCERQLGIGIAAEGRSCPVVLVNVDGYYDGFVAQCAKSFEEGIIYVDPEKLIHVASTAEEALAYCERACSEGGTAAASTDEARSSAGGTSPAAGLLQTIAAPPVLYFAAGVAVALLLTRLVK